VIIAVILAFAVPAAPAFTAPVAKPACAHELAVTETSLLKSLVRMQSVGKANASEQCETYRAHAAVVGEGARRIRAPQHRPGARAGHRRYGRRARPGEERDPRPSARRS